VVLTLVEMALGWLIVEEELCAFTRRKSNNVSSINIECELDWK
jgi:hypothetical protein